MPPCAPIQPFPFLVVTVKILQDKERVLRLLFAKINQSQMGGGGGGAGPGSQMTQMDIDQSEDHYDGVFDGTDEGAVGATGGSLEGGRSSRGGAVGRVQGHASLRQPGFA
jgi:hypothetical protein